MSDYFQCNRIWSLIQQFMRRYNLLEHDDIPFYDFIHCRRCRTRVALIQDFVLTANDLVSAGFINTLFNVEVAEYERYHRVIGGRTLANTYCVECRKLLGWKIIEASEPSWNHRVGGFYLRLEELIYWNDVTLFDFLFGGANDQDGGANEEHDQYYYRGANDRGRNYHRRANERRRNYHRRANEQDHDYYGGANEQNADQDGDANEQVPNEQDLGANEQNADQHGDANEQDVGDNEQNADQDGDANEQVPNEQDLGANEQNAGQHGDANEQDVGDNEQNADQDGGAPMN